MNIKCHLCGAEKSRDEAPFPVVMDWNERIWFCSQDCMAIEWPDAQPPLMPGDMISSEFIAYEDPRAAVCCEDEPFYEYGFDYLFEEVMPWSLWAVLMTREEDYFFLVPWVSIQAVDEPDIARVISGDESALYVPTLAEMVYVAWQHKDEEESKKPSQVFLMLGRGVWRHRLDISLSNRQQKLTPKSLTEAQDTFRRMMR